MLIQLFCKGSLQMDNNITVKIEDGYYIFKLKQLLKEKNISINKLMRDTNTDFKVIKRLLTGDIVRIDIYVLARLCNYLNCNIKDIIEYKKNSNN